MIKQADVDALFSKVEALYEPDAKEKFPDLEVEKLRVKGELDALFAQLSSRDFDPSLDMAALSVRVHALMGKIAAEIAQKGT